VPTDIVPEEEVKKRYGEEAARQYQQAMQYAREAKARGEIKSVDGAEYTREAYQRAGEPKTREEHEAAIQKVEKEIREAEKKSQAEAARAQAREELERSYKWIEELPIIREARAWQPTWGGPGFRDIQKAVATFPERALKTGAFFGIGFKYGVTKPEVWEPEKLKEVPSAIVEIGKEMLAHPAELVVDIAITGAIFKGVSSAISKVKVSPVSPKGWAESVRIAKASGEPMKPMTIAKPPSPPPSETFTRLPITETLKGLVSREQLPPRVVVPASEIKVLPKPERGFVITPKESMKIIKFEEPKPTSEAVVRAGKLQLLQKPLAVAKAKTKAEVKPAFPIREGIPMVKPETKVVTLEKVWQVPATKQIPSAATKQIPKQISKQLTKEIAKPISKQIPTQTLKPLELEAAKTLERTLERTKQESALVLIQLPKLKEAIPKPHLDILPWKERRKEVGKVPRQAKAYRPSLVAIGLKIKAPKAPKVVVGPEIRPMVRLRK
jgi:hypothetical protein